MTARKKVKKKGTRVCLSWVGRLSVPWVIGGQSFYFKGYDYSNLTGFLPVQMQGSAEGRMFAEDAKLDSNPLQDDRVYCIALF